MRLGKQPEEPVGERRPRGGRRPAKHPQPGHASVRVDVEAYLLRHWRAGDGEPVPGVGLQRGPGQQVPAVVAEGRPAGGVAHEVRGVELDNLDGAGAGQPHHDPVVVLVAPSGGLPAVAHHLR